MTPNEFRLKHSTTLHEFLQTEAGKQLISTLHQQRPIFNVISTPHAHHESSGAVRGYELCEKNLINLSTLPSNHEEIEMNYGVPDKK